MYPDYISAKKMRESYEGNVFSPMGCRSFLSPWKDEKGNYQFDGRFNMGVVSSTCRRSASSPTATEKFFQILDKRLELCKKPCSCASTSSSASRPTYRLSTGSTAPLPA